ncbi:MAG: hypothetical protein [Hatfieldvirus porci]|uniref:Neck protein n=1 Tax=phage Lak_Megaphage_RVC_JS4_GC31 TaxID=3109228 RepID=A0ABZ0Z5D3_9CAUD|nr:MAG: hypothetical protein [phage Lak_Megaphage_RVC_JS4_GC31]
MKQKAIKALYESVMHHVNEGAGAGYTVEISDLKLGNFKVLGTKFVDNGHEEKVAKFTADILPCVVEWSANGYYEGVDHTGVFYDGELMIEYSDEDNSVEGGTVMGYVYLSDVGDGKVKKSDVLEYLNDYASVINISTMYGGGWLHVNLGSPVFTFNDIDIDGNYADIHIEQINIKAPNIADNVNWYFENAYKFDEIFGGDDEDEDEFDEE